MYKFEKLLVWKEALKLTQICYKISSSLPRLEQSGIGDQLRRASTSILFNIAEGSGSNSDKEFNRYLGLSRKSLFEVIAIMKFIEITYKQVNLLNIYFQTDLVGKLLNGLIRKLTAKNQ